MQVVSLVGEGGGLTAGGLAPGGLASANGLGALALPTQRRNVEEWSCRDSVTGAIERGRRQTEGWSASAGDANHAYGKVSTAALSWFTQETLFAPCCCRASQSPQKPVFSTLRSFPGVEDAQKYGDGYALLLPCVKVSAKSRVSTLRCFPGVEVAQKYGDGYTLLLPCVKVSAKSRVFIVH